MSNIESTNNGNYYEHATESRSRLGAMVLGACGLALSTIAGASTMLLSNEYTGSYLSQEQAAISGGILGVIGFSIVAFDDRKKTSNQDTLETNK